MSLYPRWPDTLPAPQRDGYRQGGTAPVVRTEMEAGRARTYRYSDVVMRDLSFTVVLNDEQVAQFWAFFNGPANTTADWFYMPVDTANTVADHLVRFTAHPSSVPITGNQYRVSIAVETDEQHIDWSVNQ